VNTCTGWALIMSNGLDYCLNLLKILLDYWKTHLASKEVLTHFIQLMHGVRMFYCFRFFLFYIYYFFCAHQYQACGRKY